MRKVGLVFFAVIFLFSLSPFVFADDPPTSGNPPSSQNQQGNTSSQTGSPYMPYLVANYFWNLMHGGNGVTQGGHEARAADNFCMSNYFCFFSLPVFLFSRSHK